ncbi:MAG: thioredoxin family protein [Candidatus Micrarchaeota archaeon]|nr:thioredoxin family protein [Candidatus Micrarchaeota archaeon]MDE1847720.1 thioredoxin family protein [Candidatus Micrarchaeota archaeon]MDE1864149.1 thioredoxin family protein [Candidatus Micrarchaeota archaeon]
MALLSEKDIKYVSGIFSKKLFGEVELTLFVDPEGQCEYCERTVELLRELAAVDKKLKLEVNDITKERQKAKAAGINKAPGLTISSKNREMHLLYFGIPAGYQFAALLDDIVDVSNVKTRLAATTVAQISGIKKPVEISVFVTMDEQLCAGAVRIAHQFAIENPKIWASMIDAEEFTELAIHSNVTKVPKVVINGMINFEEPLPENEFLDYVMSAN